MRFDTLSILFAYLPSFLVAQTADAAGALTENEYKAVIVNAILSSFAAVAGLTIKEAGKFAIAYLRKKRLKKFPDVKNIDSDI